MTRRLAFPAILAFVAGCGAGAPASSTGPAAQPAAPPSTDLAPLVDPMTPAAFRDPARRAKLLAAMPALEKHFAAAAAKLELPGLAVGVVVDGELVWSRGYGERDAQSHAPVDADTVFRIASLTKSFTALAVLKLRDEGKLALDDAAERHVPELATLRYPTRDAPKITLRLLLSHSAGFPEDNPWGDRQLGLAEDAFTKQLAAGLPFSTAPGTEFEYSNVGFAVLGRVVARASGTPCKDYLTANVLAPLGMGATVFDERDVSPVKLARGYRRDAGKLVAEPNLPDGAYGPMGGLYSSVRDMARYASFHLAAWPPRDDAESGPVRRSSVREMQSLARNAGLVVIPGFEGAPRASAGGYAFGLFAQETCDFDRAIAHGGGLPGYGSYLYLLPDRGVGFVALANVTYAKLSPVVRDAARILAASGGLEPRAVVPSKSLAAARGAVDELVAKWDDALADRTFAASFFLDKPRAKLVEELAAARKQLGACRPDGDLDAENALRGKWRLSCDRGWVDASLTLAPMMPPTVQALTVEASVAPSARLVAAATRVVALTERWDAASYETLLAPRMTLPAARKLAADVTFSRGACKLGRALLGDGVRRARFAVTCERHPSAIELELDDAGKVEKFAFLPPDRRAHKCDQ